MASAIDEIVQLCPLVGLLLEDAGRVRDSLKGDPWIMFYVGPRLPNGSLAKGGDNLPSGSIANARDIAAFADGKAFLKRVSEVVGPSAGHRFGDILGSEEVLEIVEKAVLYELDPNSFDRINADMLKRLSTSEASNPVSASDAMKIQM